MATKRPEPGKSIFVLKTDSGGGPGQQGRVRYGCYIAALETGPRILIYTCGDPNQYLSDVEYLFSLDGTLVGIATPSRPPWIDDPDPERRLDRRPREYQAAIAVSEILKESAILSTGDKPLSPRGKKIIECANAAKGNITIREMRDCAGVWVTPRTMVRCASGPQCPTLNDTINGRAVLMAELLAQNLRLESKLLPRPQDLPPQPSAESIAACKGATGSEAYQRCVMLHVPNAENLKLLKCFEADNKTRAGCGAITESW